MLVINKNEIFSKKNFILSFIWYFVDFEHLYSDYTAGIEGFIMCIVIDKTNLHIMYIFVYLFFILYHMSLCFCSFSVYSLSRCRRLHGGTPAKITAANCRCSVGDNARHGIINYIKNNKKKN